MTVTNSARSVSLTGNGVTTVFPYTFLIPSGTSVVTLTDLTTSIAVEGEPLVEGVDYSITGEDDELGGNVTYPLSGSPLSSDYKINIKSEIEIEQTLDLTTQSAYNPTQLESQLDRMTLAILQVNEKITRAVLIASGSTTTAEELLIALSTVEASAVAAAASASAASASADAAAASAASIAPVETQINTASVVAFLDADHIAARKASSGALIKDTWASIKTAIWTALGGLINAGTAKATPVDNDLIAIADSAAANASKKVTLTSLWTAYLKAKADALYQPLASILTALGNLANGSGSLTNDGSGNLSWGSAGGMTLLGTLSLSGTSQALTGLSLSSYKYLLFDVQGMSHNNGSSITFNLELSSTNGAAYGAAVAFTTSLAQASIVYGSMTLFGINLTTAAAKTLSFNGSAGGSVVNNISTNTAAAVNALRVGPTSGSFDAGTILVYGVK